jgi:amidase
MTNPRPFTSAKDWADDIRSRTVSSLEALEFHVARIEKFNQRINAVVVMDLDRARSRAIAADAAMARGESWGPLHGVPMTVKESFDLAGLPTTWGVWALRGNIAHEDAAAVSGLSRNGAVIFGKTNVPTLLAEWQTFNPIYGTTSNPWDFTRSPGGSSGGAAAALAAGLTTLELGSDIGGSVRNPAHCCGVYGHKPSFGVVPQAGHAIPGAGVPLDLLVCGPMARSAEDLDMVLSAIAGAEPEDVPHWSLTLPASRFSRLKGVRVGVWLEDENCQVDHELQQLIRNASKAASGAGAVVDETARPIGDPSAAHSLYLQLLRGATGAVLSDETFESQRRQAEKLSDDDNSYWARTLRAAMQTHRSWFRAHERRAELRRQWAEFFKRYDVLLCPAAATAALPHDQKTDRPFRQILVNGKEENYNNQMFWAGLASLPYLPATVAPVGFTAAGLPVGVQIIGPYLNDRTTIEFARLLAAEIGGFSAPPTFS